MWAYRHNVRVGQKLSQIQAWWTASLVKAKRIPSLHLLLNPEARRVRAEEKQQLDQTHDDLIKSLGG